MKWLVSDSTHVVRLCLIATIVTCLCAYAYCWLNSLFGHDSLMIIQNDWAFERSIGRPFQQLYVKLRGNIVAPWLIGMIGTLFLSFANALMVKTINVRSRLFVILTCGLISTCSTIVLCNATYITWFDVYMLAFLLSCLSAFLCTRRKIKLAILATFLLCFSLGLYQSYLQVFIVLVMTASLRCFLANDSSAALRLIGKSALVAVLGFLLYYASQSGIQILTGTAVSTNYNAVSSAFSFGSSDALHALLKTYVDPIAYLLYPETHMVLYSAVVNALLFFALLVAVVMIARREKTSTPPHLLLALICLILLPLGAGCVNLAAYGSVHSLMILSYSIFYPLVFGLLEQANASFDCKKAEEEHASSTKANALLVCLVSLAACGMLVSNIVYANQVFIKKDLEYQATFSALTRIEERLETIPGYCPGTTPVVFFGTLSNNSYFADVRNGFPPASDQTPFANGKFTDYAVGLGADMSIYGNKQMRQYFTYILGCPINIIDEKKLSSADSELLKSMPAYPLEGSIVKQNDKILVRLS